MLAALYKHSGLGHVSGTCPCVNSVVENMCVTEPSRHVQLKANISTPAD